MQSNTDKMTRQLAINILLAITAIIFAVDSVVAYEELSDEQLDLVTAGAATTQQGDDILNLRVMTALRDNTSVAIDGSMAFRGADVPSYNNGNLVISDNAQGNLNAIVNINAVNSPVQVLLNLNITVNSTIGGVEQINITGPDGLLFSR